MRIGFTVTILVSFLLFFLRRRDTKQQQACKRKALGLLFFSLPSSSRVRLHALLTPYPYGVKDRHACKRKAFDCKPSFVFLTMVPQKETILVSLLLLFLLSKNNNKHTCAQPLIVTLCLTFVLVKVSVNMVTQRVTIKGCAHACPFAPLLLRNIRSIEYQESLVSGIL